MDIKQVNFKRDVTTMTKKREDPLVRVVELDGFELRYIQYPDTTIERIYKQGGKIIPRIPLSGHYIEQYIALMQLDKDLRNVLGWNELAEEMLHGMDQEKNFNEPDMKKNLILKSLFVSKITTYAKCFTEAKGRRITLNRANVPEEHRSMHDDLIQARHNFTAHKGDSMYEASGMSLLLPGKKKSMYCHLFSELNQANFYSDEEGFEETKKLCESLRSYIKGKQEKLLAKIYDEKIHSKPISFWLSRNGKKTEI